MTCPSRGMTRSEAASGREQRQRSGAKNACYRCSYTKIAACQTTFRAGQAEREQPLSLTSDSCEPPQRDPPLGNSGRLQQGSKMGGKHGSTHTITASPLRGSENATITCEAGQSSGAVGFGTLRRKRNRLQVSNTTACREGTGHAPDAGARVVARPIIRQGRDQCVRSHLPPVGLGMRSGQVPSRIFPSGGGSPFLEADDIARLFGHGDRSLHRRSRRTGR